jgi:Protein of unknown function (DUF1449)
VFEILEPLFAAPVLPATALSSLMIAWSIFTITVGIGHEAGGNWHFHLHDPSSAPVAGANGGGVGHFFADTMGDAFNWLIVTPSRWLNLSTVPFLLWIGVFSLTWWASSLIWWLAIDDWMFPQSGVITTSLLIVRNLACALPITKIITHPMKGWFTETGHMDSKSLIGAEAEICSYDATPTNGQAKYRTGAAPLLLNVRTDGPHLFKGTKVWITHYDSRTRIYLVSPTTTDSTPSQNGKPL